MRGTALSTSLGSSCPSASETGPMHSPQCRLVSDLKTALHEKERLYFVEHRAGNQVAKANGVTFESAVPAEHEVYFSVTDSTRFRAPTMTLTHQGGVDIEELGKDQVAQVPFD